MRMSEEELGSSTPTALSPFTIRILEAIAEAKREHPDWVGVRPDKGRSVADRKGTIGA